MGNNSSSNIKEALQDERKQSFLALRKEMMARQLLAAQLLAERQIAIQIAATRERLYWFIPFSISSFAFLFRGYRKTQSFVVLFPLIPLGFGIAYQVDFAYGSKANRVKDMTEDIMANEGEMLAVPQWKHLDLFKEFNNAIDGNDIDNS